MPPSLSIPRISLRSRIIQATVVAPGLLAAIEEIWPNSLRQRCLAHKKRNILNKVPDSARQQVKMLEIECKQLDHLRRELKLEDTSSTKPEPVKAAA